MRRTAWGICLLILMPWVAPDVLAQNNVGYYVKVAEGQDWATFDLTHSLYAPSAHSEPLRAGDIVLMPPTGDCPPNSQAACINHHQVIYDDGGDFYSIQSGDGFIRDRITVYGRRIVFTTMVLIARGLPLNPNLMILRGTGGQVDPDPEPETCTAQNIGDMGNLLTPAEQQRIADFLNSPAAENLWQNSGFQGPYIGHENRQEQAGWLFGSGNFMAATWNSGPGPCGGSITIPSSLPSGTILVHTHPAASGEWVCGTQYMNEPSAGDVQALVTAGPNVTKGLIIDADGIIVFTQDYSDTNPNAAHFKGGEDGKCGFDRF